MKLSEYVKNKISFWHDCFLIVLEDSFISKFSEIFELNLAVFNKKFTVQKYKTILSHFFKSEIEVMVPSIDFFEKFLKTAFFDNYATVVYIYYVISFYQRNFMSKTFTISIARVRIPLMLSK